MKPPRPPKPPTSSTAVQESVETQEQTIRKQRRKSGFESTMLTGSLTPKKTGLSTTLG